MVDYYTKFRRAILMKNWKAKIILSAFKQWFTSYLLHLDNGEEFRNKVMENYLKENNIDHIIEGPYNSHHQGAVEALNKTFKIFDISWG